MDIIMEIFNGPWKRILAEIFIPVAWLSRNSGAELLGKIADSMSGIDLLELYIITSDDVEDERNGKYFILNIIKEESADWGEITPILQVIIRDFFSNQEISLKIEEKNDLEGGHNGFIFVELIDNEDE